MSGGQSVGLVVKEVEKRGEKERVLGSISR